MSPSHKLDFVKGFARTAADALLGVSLFAISSQANADAVTLSDATATFYQTFNGNWLPSQMIDGINLIQLNYGNGWAIYLH
jgi:hypothetical protein